MKKNKSILKRDTSVELLRIIACLMVISIHTRFSILNVDGKFDLSRLFFGSIIGEGVTVFFMISGFFIYNSNNQLKKIKKMFISVFIPVILYIIIEPNIIDYILNKKSIGECLQSFKIEPASLFQLLTLRESKISYGGHLWYVFSYLKLVISVPVVGLLCKKENTRIRRYTIILGLVSKIVMDVQKVIYFDSGLIGTYSIYLMPIIISLIGFDIYTNKQAIMNNIKIRVISFCLYIFNHFVIIGWYLFAQSRGVTEGIRSYDSFFAIVSTSCLVIFVLSFDFKKIFVRSCINYIGSTTYYIYIIHMLVITRLIILGIYEKIIVHTLNRYTGFLGEILYIIIYSMLVFLLCFIFSTIIKVIIIIITKIYDQLRKNVKKYEEKNI